MQNYVQILILVIAGVALLWFAFNILIGHLTKVRELDWRYKPDKMLKKHYQKTHSQGGKEKGVPGEPQICPICSTKLYKGQLVKTNAFPSITGGKDRLMHIQGCSYCIDGDLERKCPVCKKILGIKDILIARIFERPGGRHHVHIVGCNHCKMPAKR